MAIFTRLVETMMSIASGTVATIAAGVIISASATAAQSAASCSADSFAAIRFPPASPGAPLSPDAVHCLEAMARGDVKTMQALRGADALIPVLSQPAMLVLIARVPSQRRRPTAYCGAGYEDHLILLAHTSQRVTLRDDFLLQSCMKSIALDSDHGDDILAALAIDHNTATIRFKWLTEPDSTEHQLSVTPQKFILDPNR